MNKNEHTNMHLSADQMERYLSGFMDSKESHLVEKHLLDCDFCNEAMEGLEQHRPIGGFKTDVELLKHRIDQRASVKTRRIIPYRELSIAASVIIILGIGIFFVTQRFDEESEGNMVAEKDSVKEMPREIKEDFLEDSIYNRIENSPEMLDEVFALEEEEAQLNAIKYKEALDEKSDAEEEVNADAEAMQEVEIVEYSEPIISEDNSVAGVPQKAMESIPPLAEEESSAPKKERRQQADEAKDKVSVQAITESAKKAESISSIASVPEGGMKDYQKYLNKNKRTPKEEDQPKTGTVVISFTVGKDGKLSKFKVEEGLGTAYDDEVIRLIKEGPKWNPALENGENVKSRVNVSVDF